VSEIPDRQDALDAFARRFLMPDAPNGNGHHKASTGGYTPTDEEVLREARKARNAAKFASLFDEGDAGAYDHDNNRADMALISHLAFYTQDPYQLDQLYRQSALMRPKWDRRDYRAGTINKVLADQGDTYHWPQRVSPKDGVFYSSDTRKGNSEETNSSGTSLPFKTGREISVATPVETEWVAYPWFAEGTITELSGPIKRAGKTTLVAHLVAKVLDGAPFMGGATKKTGVMYLTEQSPNSFRRVIRDAGLERDDFHVLYWHESRGIEWSELMQSVCAEAKARGAGLIVIDVISRWCNAGGIEENTTEFANKAMPPMKAAVADGLTVVYLRHDRKGGGEVGESGRGTSQIGGDADQLLQLTRPTGGNARATVRVLSAVGRFMDDTPEQLTIELDQERGEYRSLGDAAAFARSQAMQTVVTVLPTTPEGAIPTNTVLERALVAGCNRTHVYDALGTLTEAGTIKRIGKGRKGDPHRYYKPEEFVSSDPPSYGSDESNSNPEEGNDGRKDPGVAVTEPIEGNGNGNAPTGGWFGSEQRSYQSAAELLADPPAWLAAQLERCRAKPDSLLKPTAAAVSDAIYGSAERWREVLLVLEAHIGPDPRQRGEGELCAVGHCTYTCGRWAWSWQLWSGPSIRTAAWSGCGASPAWSRASASA
jgi:hypothetical protein